MYRIAEWGCIDVVDGQRVVSMDNGVNDGLQVAASAEHDNGAV